MNIIAIDCGASYVKFALFDGDRLVKVEQKHSPQVNTADIFSPDRIEGLIRIAIDALCSLSVGLDEIMVSVDNEMHGFVLAYEDGMPYTDYISWQTELIRDSEVHRHIVACSDEKTAEKMIKETGMPLRSGLPSSTLLWMRLNGFLDEKKPLFFYTLGDYIIKRITGREPDCHPTNAAATGLYDIERGEWNREYISILTGKQEIIFPTVGMSMIECQMDDKRYYIPPAIGDQQAALLGSGLSSSDELSINIGTGGQVSRMFDDGFIYGNYQVRPYFGGKYIKTIPHIPSGRALNVLFRMIRDIVGRIDSEINDEMIWGIIQKALTPESMNESTVCWDLSFFENALSDHTVGSVSNIKEYELTLDNMVGGVFMQMSKNYITVANRINEGMPAYKRIIFSGGVAKRWDVLRDRITEGLAKDAKVIVSENDALVRGARYANSTITDLGMNLVANE